MEKYPSHRQITEDRQKRARAISYAGGIRPALDKNLLPPYADMTLSEAVVLGLLLQDVRKFLCVLGHGSTEVGEVLRVYEEAGLVKTFPARHETAASHAAAALRWVTGEKAAMVTSIGPGALHALAGSLVPASDGLGVWYLLGDETTEDEGPNMQQIPSREQGAFLRLFSTMGEAYSLHTPGAVSTALRRGLNRVDNPHRGGPFYLLLPMNTQPAIMQDFNLDELPYGGPPGWGTADEESSYGKAAEDLLSARKVAVKLGGGARSLGDELSRFLDLADGMAVLSPTVTGVLPFDHPRNMQVGGSKGSISGNHVMEAADLLVAIGTRFVCQSDCSRTGYPKAEKVININTDMDAATHYNKTIALLGDASKTLEKLVETMENKGAVPVKDSDWMKECTAKRKEWEEFKQKRYQTPTLYDEMWQKEVLTQPAAIKIATDFARKNDWVGFFDAGDVQANGFQVVEDDRTGRTFTDTGASYMGFAVSALLATAIASRPFYGLALTGEGSFFMNPQILIDGVEHGARGCILLMDNRRMAAISALQKDQYGVEHATSDRVEVDYVAMARSIKGINALYGGGSPKELQAALRKAREYEGLSLIHLPVYYGDHELGGLGAFGRWNVGNWVHEAQKLRHKIGL